MEKDETSLDLGIATQNLTFRSENQLTTWVSNPYIHAATSQNTRKAYRSDIKHFEQWGGKLPATPELIVSYLQCYAAQLNSRTLARRLIALKHWHDYQSFPDPTLHPIVGKTMTGIMRIHGKPKDKAPPLSPEDLYKIAIVLNKNASLMAIRDNAILQIGFFGALRRSEIIAIQYEHITWKIEGIEILLPASKTDQTHEGQYCAIPYGNEILCPIKALQEWLNESNIKEGAIFRRISKNNQLSDNALTPLSINHITKRSAMLAGLANADKISPHSLRRGLATSAAAANASIKTIMQAGRWKQVNTVMEYIEASQRFEDSAAANVITNMNDRNQS